MRYKMVPSWGPSPQGFFWNLGRTLLNYKWSAKNLRILCNSTKLSAGWPLLLAYNFLDAMASTAGTYRLAAVASITFLATASTVAYCQSGRQLFVAILPYNCHPSILDSSASWDKMLTYARKLTLKNHSVHATMQPLITTTIISLTWPNN